MQGTLYVWSETEALTDAAGYVLARSDDQFLGSNLDVLYGSWSATTAAAGRANAARFDIDVAVGWSQSFLGIRGPSNGVDPERRFEVVDLRIT